MEEEIFYDLNGFAIQIVCETWTLLTHDAADDMMHFTYMF